MSKFHTTAQGFSTHLQKQRRRYFFQLCCGSYGNIRMFSEIANINHCFTASLCKFFLSMRYGNWDKFKKWCSDKLLITAIKKSNEAMKCLTLAKKLKRCIIHSSWCPVLTVHIYIYSTSTTETSKPIIFGPWPQHALSHRLPIKAHSFNGPGFLQQHAFFTAGAVLCHLLAPKNWQEY